MTRARRSALTAAEAVYGDSQGNLLPVSGVPGRARAATARKLQDGQLWLDRIGYGDSQGSLLPVSGPRAGHRGALRRQMSTWLESLSAQHPQPAAGAIVHRGPRMQQGVAANKLEEDSHKISKRFPDFFSAARRAAALRNEAWGVQRARLERQAQAADAADDADAAFQAEPLTPEKKTTLRGVV